MHCVLIKGGQFLLLASRVKLKGLQEGEESREFLKSQEKRGKIWSYLSETMFYGSSIMVPTTQKQSLLISQLLSPYLEQDSVPAVEAFRV